MKAGYASNRKAAWGLGNTVLYRMCLRDAPKHTVKDEIASKAWLIGRAYSASPQRGSGQRRIDHDPDFFRFLAGSPRWKGLDRRLAKLTVKNPFAADSLQLVLETHLFLVDLIRDRVGERKMGGRRPREHASFASKYLHFHRPDHFPIYDSFVSHEMAEEFPKARIPLPGYAANPRYARYCALALRYLASHPDVPTLRQLDRRLYEKYWARLG